VARDHLARVVGLELVEASAVEDAAQDLARVVGLPVVCGQKLVEVCERARRVFRFRDRDARHLGRRKLRDDLSNLLDASLVRLDAVVRDSRNLVVRARAPESLVVNRLARRAFDEVRAAEPHERGALDHDDDVGERREVRAARHARPHDGRHLRHAQVAPHDRVVIEDARRAVLTGEDPALVRQVHARRIDEVDDGHARAHRHLLRPQNLLYRLGPPRARLHRRVVGDDDDLSPTDAPHGRHHARGRRAALVLVVGDE
jgi:hypothetical protein